MRDGMGREGGGGGGGGWSVALMAAGSVAVAVLAENSSLKKIQAITSGSSSVAYGRGKREGEGGGNKGKKGWNGGGVGCRQGGHRVHGVAGKGGCVGRTTRWVVSEGDGDDGSEGGSRARQRRCCVGDRSVAGAQGGDGS